MHVHEILLKSADVKTSVSDFRCNVCRGAQGGYPAVPNEAQGNPPGYREGRLATYLLLMSCSPF